MFNYVNIGLENHILKDNSNELCSLLANEYVLYLKTLNFHWNITGETFISLHILLEDHYEWLKEVIDQIAERIRALGFIAPANYKTYLSQADIAEGKENQTHQEMMHDLVISHENMIRDLRNAIVKMDTTSDFATVDMLIKLIGKHEKNVWMLRSHLLNYPEGEVE